MRFDTSQQMRLGQQMKLAPRMIQSMEILQMPLTELEERIEQELENNVTLEIAENAPEGEEGAEAARAAEAGTPELERPLDVDADSGVADFERLDDFQAAEPDAAENAYSASRSELEYEPGTHSRARLDGERDAKMDAMASAPARAAPLTDQLLDQWSLADVDPELRPLGELVIAFLDDDGYLRTPLETIADRAPALPGRGKPTAAQLERALQAVQIFLDPPGVAARDARECLLLQIDARLAGEDGEPPHATAGPDDPLLVARRLVADHLDDVAQNRLPKIAAATGLPLERIKAGIEQLRRLSLAPARRLVDDAQPPIVPDAIVEYDEEHDRYIAYLNDSRLPNLRLNQMYAQMSRDKAMPKKDREFIRTNLSNAQWLIDAVNQRRHTLLRVINVVVDAQRDFFDYGPQALKPLPMTQVADQLGIHVATVSRAVADKHLLTPRGVVPLRRFFTGGTQTDTGEEVSWDAIKAALQEVIEAEDKKKPLSDEALAEELKKRGLEIARRTVAKYRDQLGIPPARLRKAY